MARADNGDEEIAHILESKDSTNATGFILRSTFRGSTCNIVYMLLKSLIACQIIVHGLKYAKTIGQTNIACLNFRYIIYKPRFDEIFSSVMTFSSGFALGKYHHF